MSGGMAGVGQILETTQREARTVFSTLREKGRERFGRTLLIALALVGGSYKGLYLPAQNKLSMLAQTITSAKTLSENADSYRLLREKLEAGYVQLPAQKDKDQFLMNAVLETLRAEGLMSESLRPPDQVNGELLSSQQTMVNAQLKFTEVLSWLARLEASQPHLHVLELALDKKKDKIGYCDVRVGVGTAVVIEDLTP
jgi:hypothetical protein